VRKYKQVFLGVAFLVLTLVAPINAHGLSAKVLRYGPIIDAQCARFGIYMPVSDRAKTLRLIKRESNGGVRGNGPYQFTGKWHNAAFPWLTQVAGHAHTRANPWWRCRECSTAAFVYYYGTSGPRAVRKHWRTWR
jgi:hypothetical protein